MLIAAEGFFTRSGLAFGWRWLHVVFGVAWIGLLWYFNLVQVPSFAEYGTEGDGPKARNISLNILARRALWYFRWAALATVVTGLLITGFTKDYFSSNFGSSARGLAISTGMLLGIIMFLNVWGVIWRNQKVVLANAANVIGGGQADPAAAAAARKAGMASRQNTIFSVSMIWFMVYTSHGPLTSTQELSGSKVGIYWVITLIIIAVLEVNALGVLPWKTEANKGLNILYDGPKVRNPLIASFGLWVVFLILTEIFFRV
jgi:uncharacterized membrane protein